MKMVDVAGAFELPQALRIALRGEQKFDGFIALGCVVRGETDHYHFICDAAMAGLMQVALQYGLCLGTALLTVTRSRRRRRAATRPGRTKARRQPSPA